MINFNEWLKLKEYSFHNYFGPLFGTGLNDEPFSKVGVSSKYIGPADSCDSCNQLKPNADCLYKKKKCFKSKQNKR